MASRSWPDRWVKAVREDAGGSHNVIVGYVSSAEPDGKGDLKIEVSGPEQLFADRPLPFDPPMIELARSQEAFEYWWRLFGYVFELTDPRTYPPVSEPLSGEGLEQLRRFVLTAEDLARSHIVNAAPGTGLSLKEPDGGGDLRLEEKYPEREIQLGFAGLLRHCDSGGERASFRKVFNRLWVEAGSERDVLREARMAHLKGWSTAVKQLKNASLNQVLRDKLVQEEGMGVLDYREPDSPAELISAFNYGDLIHWGDKRPVLERWGQDDALLAERRAAFFDAALALAQIYIGFGELVRAALSEADRIKP